MTISSINSGNTYNWAAAGTASGGQNVPATSALDGLTGDSKAASLGDAKQKFMDYMSMTPAQKMQATWLAQHGISEKDFQAMNDDDKQKIIAQMKQDIEQKIKDQTRKEASGANIDVVA